MEVEGRPHRGGGPFLQLANDHILGGKLNPGHFQVLQKPLPITAGFLSGIREKDKKNQSQDLWETMD